MAIKYLSDQGPDGTVLGNDSTDLVGLWGADPVAQASAITLTSGTLGDANTAVNSILTVLRNAGIIAS